MLMSILSGLVRLASSGVTAYFVTLYALFGGLLYLLSSKLHQEDEEKDVVPGCRRIGIYNRSNLDDQHLSKYSMDEGDTFDSPILVKALNIHPIKSCAPLELSVSDVIRTGPRFDRLFMLAFISSKDQQWEFLTQRSKALMSQVVTEIWLPDESVSSYTPDGEWVKNGGCMVVRFPSPLVWSFTSMEGLINAWSIFAAKMRTRTLPAKPMTTFRIPLLPTEERMKEKGYTREVTRIWKDFPESINTTSEIPPETLAQLQHFINVERPLGIFRADPIRHREIHRNAPTAQDAGYQPIVSFADAYPLHLINLASVHASHKMLPENTFPYLDARRFRANIYITGAPAFAEDHWKKIRIGASLYDVSCRTVRCTLPNVDPVSGVRDKHEPDRTLRRERDIDPGAAKMACLGMQMVPLLKDPDVAEQVSVGDEVEVLEVGKHRYLPRLK